ncbi:MAG: PAAR domain-containing protein [Holophagales bacterium]|nr:PAAR domain-containing protein [Holophagales bacterium]
MSGLSDIHLLPVPVPVPPHGPGFVTRGSGTVNIGNLPAARQQDRVFEACGASDPIAMGCPTVKIGGDPRPSCGPGRPAQYFPRRRSS